MSGNLAKPLGAGDTKKVRRTRKKLEGKATGGSITTHDMLRQCLDVGVTVKPLLTFRMDRHGPTLAAKEARQLILHGASGSPTPKFAQIRNLPAVRAVLVVAVVGAATTAATTTACVPTASAEAEGNVGQNSPTLGKHGDLQAKMLDGFSQEFKSRFRLCTALRISNGGGAGNGKDECGGWLKSIADALLYAPLGEHTDACPGGSFMGKKRKNGGGGGKKKKRSKGDAKRPRNEAEEERTEGRDSGNGVGADGCAEDAVDGGDDHVEQSDDEGREGGGSGDGDGDAEDGKGGDQEQEKRGQTVVGAGGQSREKTSSEMAANGVADERQDECAGVSEEDDEGEEEDEDEGVEDDHFVTLPAMESYIMTPFQLKENGFPLPLEAVSITSNGDVPLPNGVRSASNVLFRRIPESDDGDGEFSIPIPTMQEADDLIKTLPELPDLPGHVQTQTLVAPNSEDGVRTFGMDCEMCVTEQGQELTRVTLVNSESKVLLDWLVKPDNRIVDYVTRYSGVTPEMLENVTTKLCQVQAALLQMVGAGDVLVGHSLENDLKALKMVHLRCLDTSLLYPHPKKNRRSSLKFLVSMYLQRSIQQSNKGHNSVEDAIAALELAQLKVSKGPNFGAERSTDSIFDRLGRKSVPCTMIASVAQCRRHASGSASAVTSFSDDGVVQAVLKELRKGAEDNKRRRSKPPLVWAELEGPQSPTLQQVCAAAAGGKASTQELFARLDDAGRAAGHERRITRLLEELPPGVLVVVASQGIDPELPRKLDKQRKACEDRRCASVWTNEQGRVLDALEERVREGCAFFTVT